MSYCDEACENLSSLTGELPAEAAPPGLRSFAAWELCHTQHPPTHPRRTTCWCHSTAVGALRLAPRVVTCLVPAVELVGRRQLRSLETLCRLA